MHRGINSNGAKLSESTVNSNGAKWSESTVNSPFNAVSLRKRTHTCARLTWGKKIYSILCDKYLVIVSFYCLQFLNFSIPLTLLFVSTVTF